MRKKINLLFISLSLVTGFAFLFSCNTETGPQHAPNTPTSGVLKVFAEEGYSLQLKSFEYAFEKFYANADIDIRYTAEKKAIDGLFYDSCKVIMISRDLTEKEKARFAAANLFPKSTHVATSAIALVVKKGSPDTVLSHEQLLALLSGDTSDIPGIKQVIFDNENSSSTSYLIDSVLKGKPPGKNCFAVNSTAELIEKLEKSNNAIGVMDYSWICDTDEPLTKEYLRKVRTVAVSKPGEKTAFYPDQSNIATGDYPFTKKLFIMRRTADFSLGAGFITFIAGPKGQIMYLRSGLAPARQPERVIEVNTAPLTE
jgi:phosphate transport system substrate-binding protein